jgi:hypothetical protein
LRPSFSARTWQQCLADAYTKTFADALPTVKSGPNYYQAADKTFITINVGFSVKIKTLLIEFPELHLWIITQVFYSY